MSHAAVIFGCSGRVLTAEERAFFTEARPWGFILFRRNIDSPEQVRALVDSLRACTGIANAPVLIDQEGGRVQRLGPPHWLKYPPGRAYGQLAANDPLLRREIVRLGARLIAHDLAMLGINADSHLSLPVVEASLEELDARDFAPFRVLSDMPMAMTAHVVYTAIDGKGPATTSRKAVGGIIRDALGFDGLLMTDDLSMKALKGDFSARARAALAAGCDIVLHCNGDMAEMRAVLAGTRPLAGKAKTRATAALARIVRAPEPFDVDEARARFDAAFDGRWAA